MTELNDQFNRSMRDLRISVTDRCNFRCTYCMPKEVFNSKYQFLVRDDLLSFEEITRLVQIFVKNGVRKLRLTGGEPLLRKNLDVLISELNKISGIEDIALTTNASLLTLEKAQELKRAGLHRVTVSLDAINQDTFMQMNDMKVSVKKVLDGIDNARTAGLDCVKVNMVVQKDINEEEIVPMAEYFKGTGNILRFIEFMDVGNTNGWNMQQVVSGQDIVDRVKQKFPIEAVDPNYKGEVAKRWRYKDGEGEIGVITSVTQAFCGDCNRLRLSAEGSIYTCLFASQGVDLRRLLREGASNEFINEVITNTWKDRSDRYSEVRGKENKSVHKVEMSYIGG
ncbi:MAG: GTP 3',8-cyclase MoaA [Gammaproteobacteria bacterium]|nr:GTP 3',8-cyclase MoaA [Gammaproteobacteria bacterium]